MTNIKTVEWDEKRLKLCVLLVIFAVGGVFGFVYEELFYRIELGYFVKRGSTFGPWIPIYGVGAILIMLTTEKIKNHPIWVFVISSAVCGTLEYATGYVLYEYFGTRLWDYNVEIWNWGNIGGYICLRSVLFFGASALFLRYVLYPLILKLEKLIKPKTRLWISAIPACVFLLDIAIYHCVK